MNINEGRTDRSLRGGAAVALGVAAAVSGLTEPAGIVMLVVAAVLLVTAVTGFCPIYRLLGVSTVERANRAASTRGTDHAPR